MSTAVMLGEYHVELNDHIRRSMGGAAMTRCGQMGAQGSSARVQVMRRVDGREGSLWEGVAREHGSHE